MHVHMNPVKLECYLFSHHFAKSVNDKTIYLLEGVQVLYPDFKCSSFVCYLKIMKTFLKSNICILQQIVKGTQKLHWHFSRPSGFWIFGILIVRMKFWSQTQELLDLLESQCHFWVLRRFLLRYIYLIFFTKCNW